MGTRWNSSLPPLVGTCSTASHSRPRRGWSRWACGVMWLSDETPQLAPLGFFVTKRIRWGRGGTRPYRVGKDVFHRVPL